MQDHHYRQAARRDGQEVEYQDRSYGSDKKGESSYTVNNTEQVPAKIKGEDNISKSDLAILDIGKLPEDALILMVEDLGVDKNDAFVIDGDSYEVFKVADHYGSSGKKAGQRILVKPE